MAAYEISASGNFEGSNVLRRVLSDAELAAKFNLRPEEISSKLDHIHTRMLEARSRRVRPNTDDKVLTSWNALMLTSFAEAGRYLKREDYVRVAIRNGNFLLDELMTEGRLQRSWRAGKASLNAYLEDYAALVLGLLALYQSDPNVRWYETAVSLTQEMTDHFSDPDGGFFDTHDDHEKLLLRPKDIQDNATPSGNALAAQALLQLSAFSGNGAWRDQAEKMLGNISEMMERYPSGFAQWLCAVDFALAPTQEVVILGNPDAVEFQALTEVLWEAYRPHLVAALSTFPPKPNAPPLLDGRPLINQQASAYVCQNFVCNYPVTNSEDFRTQLEVKP